mgnify:CR=1 FL=1
MALNDPENTNYELIPEGAQFNDAQVTREAVVKAIFDILHAEDETPFHRTSIGEVSPVHTTTNQAFTNI